MKYLLYSITVLLIMSCKSDSKTKSQQEKESSEVTKNNDISFQAVEKLAGDFVFTEGPAVDAEGHVYFTDIPENKIYIWTTEGQLETFRENTGGANGLYFDKEGNLLACEGQKGIIASISTKGDYRPIASQYKGKRFNQPNDIWADGKGGAYFTDPKYSEDMKLPQGGMHVYYINPDRTEVTRVTEDLVKPNGLIGTPDGKTLYITDPGAGKTYSYTIEKDGTLSDKSLFVDVSGDGMTIDNKGHVYLTTDGKKTIDMFSAEGELINSISIPEQPANVCFGGKNRNELYITARTSLYRVKSNAKGVQ